jgi:hypothetical protein
MEPCGTLQGIPLPAGANPAIHWNTYLQEQLFFLLYCLGGTHGTPAGHCREPPASRGQPRPPLEHLSPGTVVLLAFLSWRRPWNPLGTLQGTPCQPGPTPPSTGTLISRYGCTSCFPALDAPMEPLRDTAGNPLPARANPAIHWNTYLQVQLFFLLSCLGGTHGTPAGHCREPPASRGRPRPPLEHLSPGTVVLLAFLSWRRPWNPLGTLQGTPCQPGPTPPSTGTLISRYSCSSCFPALEALMEPLWDTAGNPPPAGANPAIHWNTYLQVRLFFLLSCPGGTHGTPPGHCREPPASQGHPPPSTGTLISRYSCSPCFPLLEAPMEPFRDTAGNPLPVGANPAIHWYTYLQEQLYFLLSCP